MVSTSARLLSIAARRNGSLISRITSSNLRPPSSILGGGVGAGVGYLDNFTKRWSSGYPDHEVVGMPSLSPTMEAGTIASWNLGEGESFSAGDVLCEVETDKATVSFEAQDDGVIAKILADSGPTEIDCGVPILITVDDESDVDAFKDYVVEAPSPAASQSASAPSPPSAASTPPATPAAAPTPTPAATPAPTPAATGGRVIASPLAWTIAKEKGLDLSTIAIAGTGPDGRIIADDVKEYIPIEATDAAATPITTTTTSTPTAPALEPIVGENYTDYPLNAASIETANLLSFSKRTIPHYYLTVDVTLDSLISLRSTLNKSLPEDNQLSLNDLLIKAAAAAMKSCPSANASWMGDSVRMYDSVDMNVVMGNGDTLYAPLIQGVDTRGVKSISDEVASNLECIEEGTVGTSSNFSAVGTVTFMNLGMYGVKSCAPIIRAPQAVAVALGAAENRVVPKDEVEEDGELYDTKVVLTATLSCDHRVVDGAVGAQWLSAFKAAVESPETLLL